MRNSDEVKITRFGFYNPVRIRFGVGCVNDLGEMTRGYRVLLLTTPGFTRRGVVNEIKKLVGSDLVEVIDNIGPNPELSDLEHLGRTLQHLDADTILALGGGSVIDTAKSLSVMLGREQGAFSLREHLESGAEDLDGVGLRVIAVPTTAGTGSEVTPFATVWDSVNKKKYSLTGPQVFPSVALLDPMLTLSLPLEATIVTGLDAISHAFESIWNRNANSFTILLATEALKIGIPALASLPDALNDIDLRSKMLWASTLAGLAISQTRTALAHSISYPLTIHFGIPHGLASSLLLPFILRFNAEADDGRLERLALDLGFGSVELLYREMCGLLGELRVNEILRKFTRCHYEFATLVPSMFAKGRVDNNMRQVNQNDVRAILDAFIH